RLRRVHYLLAVASLRNLGHGLVVLLLGLSLLTRTKWFAASTARSVAQLCRKERSRSGTRFSQFTTGCLVSFACVAHAPPRSHIIKGRSQYSPGSMPDREWMSVLQLTPDQTKEVAAQTKHLVDFFH